MEERKIRLDNPHKFDVGVIVSSDKPAGTNVRHGSFLMVSQDELDYINSTSSLLKRGSLRIHNAEKEKIEEVVGVEIENNANFMSDEDIRKKLSGNANQLRKWLDSDIEPFVLDRIAEIAAEMNLSLNKIQVLQDKIPNYEFIKK